MMPSALLVHVPNVVWTDDDHYRTDRTEIALMAMGLFAIADTANRRGISTEIVNLYASWSANPEFDLVAYVAETRPAVVGFSAHWAKQLQSALKFARLLVAASPGLRVVMGGFSASWFARDILETVPEVHAVVRGDAETPFSDYVETVLQEAADFDRVPNLVWRRDGAVVENPRTYTATSTDLEACDFARFDLLRDADHYAPRYWTARPEIASQNAFIVCTGRGCSFNCSFCGGAAVAQMAINNRRRFMFRSPQAVMRTIESAIERGFTNLYFDYDPEPNGAYYHELFAMLRTRGLNGLTCCFGAWHLPDADMIADLRQTFACGLFQISPETWSEEARRRNKDARIHYSNQMLEETLHAIAQVGLFSQVYFGYVMPYDSREAVYGTLQYVDLLNERFGRSCEARNLRFSTDPGSPAFQRPEKHDITLFARSLNEYLGTVEEANRRGYLNNLQLFTVNSMSDEDNFLASQMPPCWYHLKSRYPATMRLLALHLTPPGLLRRLERGLLLPQWDGRGDPLRHTFVGNPDVVHEFLQEAARATGVPLVPMILAREYAAGAPQAPRDPAGEDVPAGYLNSFA